jgi:hypothetical protein
MGDTMSFGEQAHKLFEELPRGLVLPETQLARLQNRMNESLGYRGNKFIRLYSPSDLKSLPEAAAKAAIDIIPTLEQLASPKLEDIAALL